jgi:hypothetical protein
METLRNLEKFNGPILVTRSQRVIRLKFLFVGLLACGQMSDG